MTKKSARGILASLRLAESFLLNRTSATRSLHFQVTHYSPISSLLSPSSSLLQKQPYSKYDFLIKPQHRFFFSSKPHSLVELVSTKDWSQDLEKELETLNSTPLTYETVVYVLKNLDKDPLKALDFFNWVCDKHGFKPSLTVYSLMLRILGDKGTMNQFWYLTKKMSDEGWEIDTETYLTIFSKFEGSKMKNDATMWKQFYTKTTEESATSATVWDVVDAVLESDWNEDVEKKLAELKVTFSENTILKIFMKLRECPLKALRFFNWLEEHISYTHSVVTYNAILRVLGQNESIEEFWSMVEKLKSSGYEIDMDTYIKISRQFQKNIMMEDAVKLFELMTDSPYMPSMRTCSLLLRDISLNDTPDLNFTFRIVKKYEATGHTLCKRMYHVILRSLTASGKSDESEKILERMRNAGYEPDCFTYSQLVFGLCKAGKLDEACKMLDEMEAQGLVPDLRTWTILIQGHCRIGEIDQALKFYTKVLEKNLEADADLLEVLVEGLCSNGRVDAAYTLFTETVDKTNLRPLYTTYQVLIQKLLGESKHAQAEGLFPFMTKHKYPPPRVLFVDHISKCGTVDDAIKYLDASRERKYPSFSAYLHIFQSFFKQARQSDAEELLSKCPRHIRNNADILQLFALESRKSDTT